MGGMPGPSGELPDQHSDANGEEWLPLVYEELHGLARRAMASQPPGQTLQTTALLSEAWLRLDRKQRGGFTSRDHFLAVAAKAMRSILVDHARARGAEKRAGSRAQVNLDTVVELFDRSAGDLLGLDEALTELAVLDSEMAAIVELRFFSGMTHPAIADQLGLSLRSVERAWSTARAWLHARLEDQG